MNAASLPTLCAVLLALGAAIAIWGGVRSVGWRRPRVWAQAPLAALLYLALFPPSLHGRGEVLNLITPGATPQQLRALPFSDLRAMLPGTPEVQNAEQVPDLATALRLHPEVRGLSVIGAGLSPRDLPVAAGLSLRFDEVPQQGLVELQAPATVPLGQQWTLSGRVATPGARVELHDPSGAVVDTVLPDAQGRFRASASAGGEGPARFELHLIKAGQAEQITSVPLLVRGGTHLSLLSFEGAPGAEGKYWQRWVADAGFDLAVTTGLTQNVAVHQGQVELTPQRLATADLVMIDARAWDLLPPAQKSALRNAVEQGLGLLLRADVPPSDSTAADWAELGYKVAAADAPRDVPRDVVLDHALGLHERQTFTEAPVSVDATDAGTLLSADDGEVLAWQRTLGHGRVGLLRLVDSYRLQLIGEPARYGTLWAGLLSAVARPHAPPPPGPELPPQSWVGERSVLCGLGDAAAVRAPGSNDPVALSVDADGCVAYWPAQSGWQVLQSAGASWPFYVRAADDGAALRSARDQLATQLLAQKVLSELPPAAPHRVPVPRWPFLLAWLMLALATWWAERTGWGASRRTSLPSGTT